MNESRIRVGAPKASLTTEDWMEIYYALESKRSAVSDDPTWVAHLTMILGKIGIEGARMIV